MVHSQLEDQYQQKNGLRKHIICFQAKKLLQKILNSHI